MIIGAPGVGRELFQAVAEHGDPDLLHRELSPNAETMPTVLMFSIFGGMPATTPAQAPSNSRRYSGIARASGPVIGGLSLNLAPRSIKSASRAASEFQRDGAGNMISFYALWVPHVNNWFCRFCSPLDPACRYISHQTDNDGAELLIVSGG